MEYTFNSTGRQFEADVHGLVTAAELADFPTNRLSFVQQSLIAAYGAAAVESGWADDGNDFKIAARVEIDDDARSFSLEFFKGAAIEPAPVEAPVDDPAMTEQALARQASERATINAKRAELGMAPIEG